MALANGEGEGDAVPAEDQARVVVPTAAELAEGLSVDRVWEALEQALSQPSIVSRARAVQLPPMELLGWRGGERMLLAILRRDLRKVCQVSAVKHTEDSLTRVCSAWSSQYASHTSFH